jgi:hypothetical protein
MVWCAAAVLDLPALRRLRIQPLLPFLLVLLVRPIEAATRHVQLGKGASDRQGGVFHQVDDLASRPGSGESSVPRRQALLSMRSFSDSSATSCYSCSSSARISFTCRLSAGRSASPTRHCFPASSESLLHRDHRFDGIPLPAAQGSHADLTPQPLEHNPDPLLCRALLPRDPADHPERGFHALLLLGHSAPRIAIPGPGSAPYQIAPNVPFGLTTYTAAGSTGTFSASERSYSLP